ncbi:MAG: COG4223 family protein [Caulobacteraceae bacterium]
MSALPDPAELAPSRDPAAYGRRRLLSPTFWAMMSLSVLCVLAGVAIVSFAPRLFRTSAPAPAAAPLPEAAPPATSPPSPAPAPTSEAGAASVGEIADLDGRVRRLETGQQRALAAAAEALAAASLGQAAAGPRPFADDLLAAERALPASPDLIALRSVARIGAPSRPALAAEFADLAARASAAARRPGREASVVDQIAYAISQVIDIRRVDGSGGGADAVIAKAQRRADDGDLEGAVALVQTLPAPAREPLGPWLAQARNRIVIDRHVAALRDEAVADLSAAERGWT